MNRKMMRASQANGRRLMRQGWSRFEPGPSPVGKVGDAYETWINNLYMVFRCRDEITEWGIVSRIMVRRNDGGTNVPWADMQRVKNEIMGQERLAIQIFPPESDLVDDANIYHLWVMPDGFTMPFGL